MIKLQDNSRHSFIEANCVSGFFDSFRFLSNFHPCSCYLNGILFPASENAYMSQKTHDPILIEKFSKISPNQAKKLGGNINLIDNWDNIRTQAMQNAIDAKFDPKINPDLCQKLANLYNIQLFETNDWDDTFWGIDQFGKGNNNLGKILMQKSIELVNTHKFIPHEFIEICSNVTHTENNKIYTVYYHKNSKQKFACQSPPQNNLNLPNYYPTISSFVISGLYKHHKGNLYYAFDSILEIDQNNTIIDKLVFYRSHTNKEFYLRPKDMFFDRVDNKARFRKIG